MHDKIVIKTLHGSAASAATQTVWGGVVIYFFLQISDSVHLQKKLWKWVDVKVKSKEQLAIFETQCGNYNSSTVGSDSAIMLCEFRLWQCF